ncbi:MAG: alpha/beta hydrolase [Myxococcales bacterium]
MPALPGVRVVEIAGPRPVWALWSPPPDGGAVVAFFHGNASQLADQLDELRRFSSVGLGFYAIEFPGYGPAHAQEPSELAFYEAAEAGLRHLTGELGVPPSRLALLGRSLGSGVAVEMAARGWGQRLVLVASFTSIPDVARRSFPFLPLRWLIRDRFESAVKAPAVSVPVLALHGEADEVVPLALGARLAQAFPRAAFVPLPRTGHDDVFERHPGLYARIAEFCLPTA